MQHARHWRQAGCITLLTTPSRWCLRGACSFRNQSNKPQISPLFSISKHSTALIFFNKQQNLLPKFIPEGHLSIQAIVVVQVCALIRISPKKTAIWYTDQKENIILSRNVWSLFSCHCARPWWRTPWYTYCHITQETVCVSLSAHTKTL